MIALYLDACCLNLPFDDQSQDRVRLEAEAVLLVLSHVERDGWGWIGSEVRRYEVGRNPDPERRRRVLVLLQHVREEVALDADVESRGSQLEQMGFGAFDALHLASAERTGADVFLTTDDGLLRAARRNADQLAVAVENPLNWLEQRSRS